MQHVDAEVLGLAALGEALSEQDAAHVAACAQCRQDVEELGAVVATVRVDVPVGTAVLPPPRVWDAIAAQTGVTVAPRPAAMRGDPPARAQLPAEAQPMVPDRPDPVVGPARQRAAERWWRGPVLAVAASALVLGAAGGAGVATLLQPDEITPPPAVVVAQVDLAGLKPDVPASGRAQVVQGADGPRLKVDVSQLGPVQGHFYEVWLIDSQVKKMVPIGILRGDQEEFVIPTGLDLSQYPIVDISVQAPGDPRHSGNSVLRGVIAG